jgi:hypothetical protein
MFDYYKAWDKFAEEETKGISSGTKAEVDQEFLEAKNPVPEPENTGPMS